MDSNSLESLLETWNLPEYHQSDLKPAWKLLQTLQTKKMAQDLEPYWKLCGTIRGTALELDPKAFRLPGWNLPVPSAHVGAQSTPESLANTEHQKTFTKKEYSTNKAKKREAGAGWQTCSFCPGRYLKQNKHMPHPFIIRREKFLLSLLHVEIMNSPEFANSPIGFDLRLDHRTIACGLDEKLITPNL